MAFLPPELFSGTTDLDVVGLVDLCSTSLADDLFDPLSNMRYMSVVGIVAAHYPSHFSLFSFRAIGFRSLTEFKLRWTRTWTALQIL